MGACVTLVDKGDAPVGADAGVSVTVTGGTVRVAQACNSSNAAAPIPNAKNERQTEDAPLREARAARGFFGGTYAWAMELILLEALFVLCIAIAMVWWTMFSGRPKRSDDDSAPQDDAPGGEGKGDQ
jgi:hypothetical protein